MKCRRRQGESHPTGQQGCNARRRLRTSHREQDNQFLMKKFARAVILILCSVAVVAGQVKGSSPPGRDGPKLSTMIDRVRPSVVQILAFFGPPIGGNGETGTGFFVSPDGIVVTAKHVISSQPNTPCDTSPLKPQEPPKFDTTQPKPVQASKILIQLPQVPQHVGSER